MHMADIKDVGASVVAGVDPVPILDPAEPVLDLVTTRERAQSNRPMPKILYLIAN